MEFLVPWGRYFQKSGGTITGNLLVLGNLEVQGTSTLQDFACVNLDVQGQAMVMGPSFLNNVEAQTLRLYQTLRVDGVSTLYNTLKIIKDSFNQFDPHILLSPKSSSGGFCNIMAQTYNGLRRGLLRLTTDGDIGLNPTAGREVGFPSVNGDYPNYWRVQDLNGVLEPRRVFLLHTFLGW